MLYFCRCQPAFFYILLFLLCCSAKVTAQFDSLRFVVEYGIDRTHAAWPLLKRTVDTVSALKIRQHLRSSRQQLQEAGYLLADFKQDANCSEGLCRLALHLGPRYEWANLENGNLPPELLRSLGYESVLIGNALFQYRQLAKIQKRVLEHCENNGYPFAQLYLDSLDSDTLGHIAARLFLDYGPLIHFDSLVVVGKSSNNGEQKVRISRRYLSLYLGLKKGSDYDESQILKIKKRLRELPFLSLYQDPKVLFRGEKAEVLLFLETRRASKFDVLFGLLPSTNPSTQQQQFNFTGNVNIDLVNSLGRGERLMAQWQQFQKGRSELRLGFAYPYLFATPLGIDAKFELYRRDSTYIDVIGDLGISYLFDGNNFLKVYWKNSSTNVQSPDTASILRNRRLPAILDLRNNSFGLEYYFQRLDYRWNPLSGFELRANAAFGFKYIKRNSGIAALQDPNDPGFDFSSLYDSISTKSFQYQLQLSYAQFIPLWKQLTIMGRYRTGWVFNNKQQLYTNELFRIGGQQSLRGFDEQSIFASWYQVATTELRYRVGTNSYTYLFGDLSYVQNQSVSSNLRNWYYGFGVGLALETKVGIFGLSYALGSSFDNPLLIRNGKIHFGYVNIF